MEIKGKGIVEYRMAFKTRRIKPDDSLFVQNSSLEHYIIMENGSLDWGNAFQKKKIERFTIKQILSKRNWYVKL